MNNGMAVIAYVTVHRIRVVILVYNVRQTVRLMQIGMGVSVAHPIHIGMGVAVQVVERISR